MKFHRVICLSMGVFLMIALTGCNSAQKGTKEHFRLKEPRLAPLTEAQWNEEQTKLLVPYKTEDGNILNVGTTLARHPKLFERFMTFAMYILQGQTLPDRDREILILRIGWLCQAEYEFGHHTLMGKTAGLTDEEILRITKGPDDPGWSVFDAALVRAVDELYCDAIISDATWKVLSERYNENQLMDVIFTVGDYNLVSWALNSFGVQLEKGVPGFPEGSKK
ncbi:MAG: carboxymuconolactone decarboxylase family protein [Candidatus Hodarchaeota archaeon]